MVDANKPVDLAALRAEIERAIAQLTSERTRLAKRLREVDTELRGLRAAVGGPLPRQARGRSGQDIEALTADTKLDEIGTSVRVHNVIDALGVTTVGELAAKSVVDVLRLKGAGRGTLAEVRALLREAGLHLRDDAEGA